MSLTLSRPALLARAARAGAALYRRERDLSRLMPGHSIKRGKKALIAALASAEAACESDRSDGVETYSVQRHISLLSALFAESKKAHG